jgi:1-acyl-sn-glycerol-3-phosphate acyltransferase
MKNAFQTIRCLLFSIGLFVASFVHSVLTLCLFWLKYPQRYRFITLWSRFMLWWVRVICGIHYHVEGLDKVPHEPMIIMSNHQSTWETFAYHVIFPLHCNVLRKEYLRIPLFGWGLSLLEPIAIDRKQGASALHQLLDEGKTRLEQGRPILIFPEGTRIAPHETKKFNPGGALLASQTGYPVLLVAHNAGKLWGRRQFFKKPGTVTVRIGPLIDSKNHSAREINKIAEAWINQEKQLLVEQAEVIS